MTQHPTTAADAAELDEFLRAHPNLESLETFIIDVNGLAIGKRLPIREARAAFSQGVAFSACAPILDCRGRGHNPSGLGGSDGDPDGILVPLASTLVPVPWSQTRLAQVMCAMHESATRTPVWFDPRIVLQRVIDRCVAAGIHPVVACELEFYLVSRQRNPEGGLQLADTQKFVAATRRATNLSLEAIEDQHGFLSQVCAAAQQQRLPLSAIVAEYGVGQFEINLKHTADPLLAADQAVLLRRLVRGVARANGIDATFMAKPFLDQPGNGLHIHVSVTDAAGANRFAQPGEGELLLAQAVAGLQATMFDAIGLFAPNLNSWRRFSGPYVCASNTWGYNNRSVAFRIPTGDPANRRIEHRVAGADASPHLAVAAVLSGMLHGITRGLKPTEPTSGRAPAVKEPRFPRSLHAALDRLGHSEPLAEYFSSRYLSTYADLKRGEFDALLEVITPRELDFYA